MVKPSILLIAGHRSVEDAGNPNEEALTGEMVLSYRKALTAAGYAVSTIPADDMYLCGTCPQMPGSLDTFGRLMAQWCAVTPGEKLLLDCHFGGEPVGGCFAIVPDKTGLGSAIGGWDVAGDTWDGNTGDRRLARYIVDAWHGFVGMPLRTVSVREPGIMSETQTGVALRYGARLATMAYTAAYRVSTVRLVLEHGNLNSAAPNERSFIYAPGFRDKCAAALLEALEQYYGEESQPMPEPTTDPITINPKLIWPGQTKGKVGQAWEAACKRRKSWGVPDSAVWGKPDDNGGTLYLFTDGLLIRRDDKSGNVDEV